MAKRTIVEILLQARDLTGRAFTGALGRLRSFKDSIFSLRTAVAGFAAFVTTRVVGQIVKAFAEQEQAVIRLNTALRVTGRFTEDGTKKIQAMSEEMQRLTTVSDEAALGISATLAQLATGLTTDQLAEAQRAVIGLSSAFGIDLQSAAQLVGKTLAGEMNALGRYGIRVDATATQQEKFNQIVRQSAGFFDVAVGSAQSLTGQYLQAKNAIGELLETFGQIIAETFSLNTEQGNLRDRINEVNDRIKANLPEWVKWGRVLLAVVTGVVRTFANVVKFFFNAGQVIGDVFVIIYTSGRRNFQNLYNTVVGFLNDLIQAFNAISPLDIPLLSPILMGEVEQALADAKEQLQTDAQDIRDSITNIGVAWSGVVREIKKNPLPAAKFDFSTAGGGPNTGAARTDPRDRIREAGRIQQRFALGGMSTADFEAEMARLVPLLQAVRDSQDAAADPSLWVEAATAIEKFREEAEKAGILITSLDDTASSTFGQAFAQRIHEATAALGMLNESLAATTVDAMFSFGAAATEAFALLSDGARESGKDFEAAMLGALAAVASSFAQMFAARAVGALAEAVLPSSVLSGTSGGGLAAAGYFTAAALAMSALSGAIRGAAARTAGGGGGGGASGAAARTNDLSADRGSGTIVVQGGILDMSDPRQADAFAAAVEQLTGRRIILQG